MAAVVAAHASALYRTLLGGSSVTAVTKHSICCISTCYCALNRLPIIYIVKLLPLCLVCMILS